MIGRLSSLIILACAPTLATASGGIVYAAIYECRAARITEAMTNACASLNPEVSARASVAYSKWIERNAAKAETTAQACVKGIRRLAKTETERQEVLARMQQTEREMIQTFKDRIESEGVIVCSEALGQLETGTGGVDLE